MTLSSIVTNVSEQNSAYIFMVDCIEYVWRITLKMEDVSSCETLVMVNQTTEHDILEDINRIFTVMRI
jgi:hypothetical protein